MTTAHNNNDPAGVQRAGPATSLRADLASMPHNAVVAIAARAVRRVFPILSLWVDLPAGHASAIQGAVNLADDVAAQVREIKDRLPSAQAIDALAGHADNALGASITEGAGGDADADAPEIVYHLTLAAGLVVETAFDPEIGPMLAAEAVEAALAAFTMALPMLPAIREPDALLRAIQSDIDFLRLQLSRIADGDTRPIRAADVGVLWPDGEPAGLTLRRPGPPAISSWTPRRK